jgi:hypothetical protein
VKEVREFLGALTAGKFAKGHFVTLTGYTGPAKHLAHENGIEIVSQKEISRLIQIAEADEDLLAILNDPIKRCPKCERQMELHAPTPGPTTKTLWRCTAFPDCQQTIRAAA